MLTFAIDGDAGVFVRYATAAAQGFADCLLNIPITTTHFFQYTSGSAVMTPGIVVTGATSAATARITGNAILSGTVGGGDVVGVLFVEHLSGTFQAENLKIPGGTDDATVVLPVAVRVKGLPVKKAFITTEGAVTVSFDGSVPTLTAGTDIGHEYATALSFWIVGAENIRRFQFINTVNASGALLKATLFY